MEAAVEIGTDAVAGASSLIHAVVIPQLHADMAANLLADTCWRARAKGI
jgi:hypothetical protein